MSYKHFAYVLTVALALFMIFYVVVFSGLFHAAYSINADMIYTGFNNDVAIHTTFDTASKVIIRGVTVLLVLLTGIGYCLIKEKGTD